MRPLVSGRLSKGGAGPAYYAGLCSFSRIDRAGFCTSVPPVAEIVDLREVSDLSRASGSPCQIRTSSPVV